VFCLALFWWDCVVLCRLYSRETEFKDVDIQFRDLSRAANHDCSQYPLSLVIIGSPQGEQNLGQAIPRRYHLAYIAEAHPRRTRYLRPLLTFPPNQRVTKRVFRFCFCFLLRHRVCNRNWFRELLPSQSGVVTSREVCGDARSRILAK
jgi:hypothetical protein